MELDKNAGQDPGASRVSAQPAQWREWLSRSAFGARGGQCYLPLIIDDVLDHDVVRRGQRTVHCLFGHIPATAAAGKLCTQVAGSGEVMRFKPDGTVDRRINIPAKTITSVAFGGPDICDLYIVTANNDQRDLKGTVFRSRSEIPGLPVPKAKF